MKEITSDTFINLAKKIEEVNRNLKIKQLIDNIISIKKEIFHNKWDINNYYDKWIQLRNEIDHTISQLSIYKFKSTIVPFTDNRLEEMINLKTAINNAFSNRLSSNNNCNCERCYEKSEKIISCLNQPDVSQEFIWEKEEESDIRIAFQEAKRRLISSK